MPFNQPLELTQFFGQWSGQDKKHVACAILQLENRLEEDGISAERWFCACGLPRAPKYYARRHRTDLLITADTVEELASRIVHTVLSESFCPCV